MVALSRAVIDRLLKTDVLPPSKKIKRVERGGRIGKIENEMHKSFAMSLPSSTDPPLPNRLRKGEAQLLERAGQCEIDGVAG